MATDPHIDQSDDDQSDEPRDDEPRDDERAEREKSERGINPEFQRIADEIGRRFRQALDKLA